MLAATNSAAVCLMHFNNRVNKYLSNSQTHMVSTTIQVQRQISRQLKFQSCLPVIIAVFGGLSIFCLMLLQECTVSVVMILFCPFQWIPALNPIITIFCIADYRRQFFAYFEPDADEQNGTNVVVLTGAGNVDGNGGRGDGTVTFAKGLY
uniref:G_PROTEIN_RECEP_F1_2 domain-containing protein n=1 Tax=Panagrellus redivivus TaxID=6233 RepID=A0A7E4VUF9_PANRE